MSIKQFLVLIFTSGIIFGILSIVKKCPYGYGLSITSMLFFLLTLTILKDGKK
jgi:hypothetical protein